MVEQSKADNFPQMGTVCLAVVVALCHMDCSAKDREIKQVNWGLNSAQELDTQKLGFATVSF